MNRYNAILLSIVFAFSAFAQDSNVIEYNGGKSPTARTTLWVDGVDYSDKDLLLHSDTGVFYGVKLPTEATAKTMTYRSLKAVVGSGETEALGDFHMAYGTLNLDANTSEKNFTVFEVAYFALNYATMYIKNTNASSKNPLLFKANSMDLAGGTKSQNQKLYFYANTDVNIATSTLGRTESNTTGTSLIYLAETKTLNWTGDIAINQVAELRIDGVFNLYGDATFNDATGLLYIGNSGGLKVTSGKTVNLGSATFKTLYGSHLNIEGGTFLTDGAINLKRTTVKNGTFTQSAGGVVIERDVKVVGSSTFTASDSITLRSPDASDANGNLINAARYAKLTIGYDTNDKNSKLIIKSDANGDSKIILGKDSFVYFNTENSVQNENGNHSIIIATEADAFNTNVEINSNQKFGGIALSNTSLKLTMADNALLELTNIDNAFSSDGGILNIYNFVENSIKVGDNVSVKEAIEQYVKLFDINGVALDSATVINGYIAFATSVPEPAEWAMLLGAIALGLAVYRKRK